MKNTNRLIALFCAFAFIGSAQTVQAASSKDSAYDDRGNFVIDTNGNCVRTKWMQDDDPCNPTPPPPPPPPPPPVKVEPPAPKRYMAREELTIHFAFDSDELDAEATGKLDRIAEVVNSSLAIRDLHVLGYTDQIGSNSYNQKLSEERVEAVVEYLKPRTRLKPKTAVDIRGLGKAPKDPACAEIKSFKERKACMRSERRVEIKFKYEFEK